MVEAFARSLDNPRLSMKARFRAVHENGDLVWVEAIGTNMLDDPIIRGILVALNDITELVEARSEAESSQAELAAEKEHFEALAQFTPTGVFELGTDNVVTYQNERFEQLMGLGEGATFDWQIIDERDRDGLQATLSRARTGTTGTPAQSTVRLSRPMPDGQPRWLAIRAVRQATGRVLASVDDATTQMTKEAELAHRADHDVLTGLPNRESLLELLEELTEAQEDIAVLFLDLDGFKDINDGLGHQVGDQVLIEVAGRIQNVVRPSDIVGRLHGDEFLIVCRRTSNIDIAREIASRVVDSISSPLQSAPQRLVVSGSVGIALTCDLDPVDATPEKLLVAADVAMYEAKRQGGSRSVPFNERLGKRAADRLRLHGEVQRANELDELVVHYQPIVDLRTGKIERYEALIRWHHPTQGFILPERFIPDIEKSELIDELGMWVLNQVLADLKRLGPAALPVNVNVSPRQLTRSDFATATLDLLQDHQIDGHQLTIEITELVMMEDFGPVEQQLDLLQSHGVGIAVDDFGSGYSALAYLQRFPFDQIKIDGGFMAAIDTIERDRAIVGSIIDLVTALGATAIAEKVERQDQVDVLLELNCQYAQGFLLGRPKPLPSGLV